MYLSTASECGGQYLRSVNSDECLPKMKTEGSHIDSAQLRYTEDRLYENSCKKSSSMHLHSACNGELESRIHKRRSFINTYM